VPVEEADAADRAAVEAALGGLFTVLPPEEQRYLVFAERLARDPELALFAAAAYGLTLEAELAGRIFRPLKAAWIKEILEGRASTPPLAEGNDSVEGHLTGFLTGGASRLYLGPMVMALGKGVLGRTGEGVTPWDQVRRWVAQTFGQPALLLELPSEPARQHLRRLNMLKELRNRAAHPEGRPPGPKDSRDCRDALIGPDGFLPVYLRAWHSGQHPTRGRP
jgi:hypothetical protein